MRLKLFSYKKVLSTNSTAINIIKNKGLQNGIVISDEQLKGRGRYGNKWISLKGNLFTTVFISLNKKFKIHRLLKINCNIVKKTLSEFLNKSIKIKQPNDLIIDKKKICGILQELIEINGKKYLIVGIGVNIVKSPQIKDYKTTYVNKYLNKNTSKKIVFNKLKRLYEMNLKKIKCI